MRKGTSSACRKGLGNERDNQSKERESAGAQKRKKCKCPESHRRRGEWEKKGLARQDREEATKGKEVKRMWNRYVENEKRIILSIRISVKRQSTREN